MNDRSILATAARTILRVTALVLSRLNRRGIHAELARLNGQTPLRRLFECSAVLAALFGLAIFAASFGWVGLLAYFIVVAIVFR